MMYYLGEDDNKVLATSEDIVYSRFFTFNVKEEDYFLNFFVNYDSITTEMYVFRMGKFTFHIPSGFYVYTGDVVGSVDWILVDEMVGRSEIETFLMPTSFKSWQLEPSEIQTSYTGEFFLPSNFKDAIPLVSVCGGRCILVSPKDLYHTWKNKDYDSAFVV